MPLIVAAVLAVMVIGLVSGLLGTAVRAARRADEGCLATLLVIFVCLPLFIFTMAFVRKPPDLILPALGFAVGGGIMYLTRGLSTVAVRAGFLALMGVALIVGGIYNFGGVGPGWFIVAAINFLFALRVWREDRPSLRALLYRWRSRRGNE